MSCSHEHGEDTHTHGEAGEVEDVEAESEDAEVADQEQEAEEELSSTLYQCPHDCGDGEAFWEPGECASCGMEMEVIKDAI